jgi:cytochrome b involved in lipid metabolism
MADIKLKRVVHGRRSSCASSDEELPGLTVSHEVWRNIMHKRNCKLSFISHKYLQVGAVDVLLPQAYRHTAEELLEQVRRQSDASDASSPSQQGPSLTAATARSLLASVHGRVPRSRSTDPAAASRLPISQAMRSAQSAPIKGRAARLPHPPPKRDDGKFTLEEVAEHCTVEDCWLVAHGVVYDVTSFLAQHPAGVAAIMRHAGKESSEDFQFHSKSAQQLWREYKVGNLQGHKSGCCLM